MTGFLRQLSPSEQVSLLFVLVFGLLALASALHLLFTLRDGDADEALTRRRRDERLLLRHSWAMAIVFWCAWVWGAGMAVVLFGLVSFFVLREFISASPTRRADHRSLVLVFFVVLPAQFALVWTRHADLFTVFIPVYVFIALPVVSALRDDPQRFLERNAKLQWGIMVCVYGLSHVPALWLLDFRGWTGQNEFLVFFLVAVVQTCMLVQHVASRGEVPSVAPAISRSFHWRGWALGLLAGAFVGALLSGLTPFKPLPAVAMALVACAAGSLGHLVMKAIKRDRGITHWGLEGRSVTGAGGLLDRVDALCFAAPVFFHSVRWNFG